MAHFYKLAASFTKGDVGCQAWLRKVNQLLVVEVDGGIEAFFASDLKLAVMQSKTSIMKGKYGLQVARVQELTEDEWVTSRAAAVPREEPSSSSAAPGGSTVTSRSGFNVVMDILPTLTPLKKTNI